MMNVGIDTVEPLIRSPKGNGKKFEIAGFRNTGEA